jgi:TIR domain
LAMLRQVSYHVFLSYSWRDVTERAAIATALKKLDSIRVWVDEDFISPGDSIHDRISQAIDTADCVVALITPASLASKEVVDELTRAHERGRRIVPIVAEGVGLDNQVWHVRDLRRIDYRPGDLPGVLAELVAAVKKLSFDDLVQEKAPKALKDLIDGGAQFVSLADHEKGMTHADDYVFCQLRMRQTRAKFVFCARPTMRIGTAAELLVTELLPHTDPEDYEWSLTYEDGTEIPSHHTLLTAGIKSGSTVYLIGRHRMPQWAPAPPDFEL